MNIGSALSFRNLFRPAYKHQYLRLLAVVSVLRGFVIVSAMLFLPGIMLGTLRNFGCDLKSSMIIIGGLYALLAVFHLAVTLPASWFVRRIGIKGTFLLSILMLMLFIPLTFGAETVMELAFGFMIWGASAGMWWYTYHTFFLEVGDKDKVGKETAIFMLLQIGVSLIVPLVIGLMLSAYSGTIIGHFLVLLCVMILFLTLFIKDFERLPIVKATEMIHDIRKHPRRMCSYFAMGGDSALSGFVWPLFLTLVLKDPMSLGIFAGLVTVVTAIAAFVSGKLSDKVSKTRLEHIGGTIIALSWFARTLTSVTPLLFLADIVYRVFHSFFVIPMDAYTYEIGMQHNKARVVALREFGVMIGYLVTVGLFILLIYWNVAIQYVFLFGTMLGASTWLLKSDKRQPDDPRLGMNHLSR